MAIANYTDLVSAVSNWLARSDLSARIPEFITLSEAKMNRNLSVRQMEQRSTATIDTTDDSPEFVSLPSDFQSMRWVRLNGVTGKPTLQYASPAALSLIRASVGDATGEPRRFTILSSEIELCPTPDDDYTLEMVYRKNIPALNSGNPTNWLLSLAPDAYLYGTLLEACAYTQNDERLPIWLTAYRQVIEDLNNLNITSSYGAAPVSIMPTGPTP